MQKRMDWRAVNFDWNRARAFLVTAEEGSLSAAARALGMAQPTLGRQVSALEAELGVTLFERVGRGLALTEAGRDLVEHVRAMGAAAERVSLTAAGQAQALDGPIRVTASEAFAAWLMPPILARLRREAPGIVVTLVASNDVSDLRRREADIAIRSGAPGDPELVGQRLRDDTAPLYASAEYLGRAGPFDAPDVLARADFIGFEENDGYLAGLRGRGLPLESARFPIRSASHVAHWEMARRGLGIGVMSALIGDRDPAMRRAAPWLEPFTYPIWLVAHRELATSRRVRLVFDLIAEEIRALPGPEAG